MGAVLTKPVLSTVVERKSLPNGFRVGLAEMNGWRNKMEDAHVIHMKEEWGFFGVFDGHGGDQCSAYVAKKFYEQLSEHGCPVDDADLKRIVFKIDDEFLEAGLPSGTTAAMCVAHRPTQPGGKMRLRVANIGDSRVLLGRRDGTIVDGGGTDQGLSTDHKPDHPSEKERIYRCGGTVEASQGGVARVNGDLAVSRGFGDAEYKKTGGPGPEDRPVTADPELGDFECDDADFLVIVCDGVSEGDFPNPEVIKLIANRLKEKDDIGSAARDVVLKAEKQNSKDNITCMIVLFNGSPTAEDRVEFIPGPMADPSNKNFLDAYQAMAKRADLTLEKAVEMRYDYIQEVVSQYEKDGTCPEEFKSMADAEVLAKIEEFKMEAEVIGEPEGEKGSPERDEWFEKWRGRIDVSGDTRPGFDELARHLMQERMAAAVEQQQDGRRVRAPDRDTLFRAVEEHSELFWEARMEDLPGVEGVVKTEDKTDGTMQVRFAALNVVAWLPTAVLTVLDDDGLSAQQGSVSGGYSAVQHLAGMAVSGGYASDTTVAPSDDAGT